MSKGYGKIRLLKRNEISNENWDLLSSKSSHEIFMSSWYLDAVMPNWSAIVLNDYEACLPIQVSKKYHLKYCLQPLFIRAFSVLGNQKKAHELLVLLKEEISFFNLAIDIEVNDKQFKTADSVYQSLELNQEYESIYKAYSQNVKRSLRDFLKSNAELTEENDREELITMFKSLKGKEFSHLNDGAYQRLSNLMKEAQTRGASIYRGVRLNGELLAIGFFIRQGQKLLYLKGIVNSKGKSIGAMQAIFNSVIKENASSTFSLDFGGSNNHGLAVFNKKFGAIDRKYLILKYNGVSWPLRILVNRKIGIK